MTGPDIAIDTPAPENGAGAADFDALDAGLDGTESESASALADDKAEETFWTGDVTELEGDELSRWKSLQRDYTQKRMADSEARKAFDAEAKTMRETLQKQQADLQQLAVQLQARLAADGTDTQRGSPEKGDALGDLRKGFDSRVQRGEGFEAMVDLVKSLSGETSTSIVSEREKALQERIDTLEGRLSGVEGGFAPYKQRETINAAFDELRGSQYRGEFESPKVRQEILKQLESPGEIVSELLEAGNVKAAIALLGERAIRQVREGQSVDRAKRRTEASSLDSKREEATDAPKRKGDFDSTEDYLKHFFSLPANKAKLGV